MAYFECIMGNGGGGTEIPLIVTCSPEFAGSTISITKGATTLTQECPSSSPYEVTFTLPEDGTWTISGEVSGITFTETVVISAYTAELIAGAKVTLYSAASDTVYYYPDNDTTQTAVTLCTTDVNGEASDVIVFPNIVYYSTVGKNPDDLTSPYSKVLYSSPSQGTAHLMPDNSLYWYGYKSSDLEECSATNGWTASPQRTWLAPTFNTNYIDIYSVSQKDTGVGSKNIITGLSKLYSIVQPFNVGSSNSGSLCTIGSKSVQDSSLENAFYPLTPQTPAKFTLTPSTAGNHYALSYCVNGRHTYLYAMWYE